jgi:hypothetical protein
MAYTRGSNANIIVGAAALFTYEDGELGVGDSPAFKTGESYRETLDAAEGFRNVGYTTNGIELDFQPTFGEVMVDQVLDVAKLFKQGMKVNLKTTFVESTLENLLFSLAGKGGEEGDLKTISGNPTLNLSAGDIGECPVERGLVAVGPGTGDCAEGSNLERIYTAYRALSIENVTVSAKRDAATEFAVSFRLLPNDSASYGKIVDRTVTPA